MLGAGSECAELRGQARAADDLDVGDGLVDHIEVDHGSVFFAQKADRAMARAEGALRGRRCPEALAEIVPTVTPTVEARHVQVAGQRMLALGVQEPDQLDVELGQSLRQGTGITHDEGPNPYEISRSSLEILNSSRAKGRSC